MFRLPGNENFDEVMKKTWTSLFISIIGLPMIELKVELTFVKKFNVFHYHFPVPISIQTIDLFKTHFAFENKHEVTRRFNKSRHK